MFVETVDGLVGWLGEAAVADGEVGTKLGAKEIGIFSQKDFLLA